jgi:hypothetical protein
VHLLLAILAAASTSPRQLNGPSGQDDPNVVLRVCPGGCGSTLQGSWGETLTYTGASAHTCPNDDGTVQVLGSGVPCMPKATSGASNGYGARLRQATSNLAQFSDAMTTAPWSSVGVTCSPPTATANSTDLLDPYGGNTATKLVFTACSAAASAEFQADTYTATAAAYTTSVYLRTLSGTYSVNVLAEPAGGASGGFTTCTANANQWTRCIVPNINETAAGWALGIGFDGRGVGSTAIGAGTVYASGAQANPGTVATDLCKSVGATSACTADQLNTTALANFNLGALGCASLDVINDVGFNNAYDRIIQGHTAAGAMLLNPGGGGGVGLTKGSGTTVATCGAGQFVTPGQHHVSGWWNSTSGNAQCCVDGVCGSIGAGYDGSIINNEAIDICTYGSGSNDANATCANVIIGKSQWACP